MNLIMLRNLILLLAFLFLSLTSVAKDDPVLMRVGGCNVSLSEFEHYLRTTGKKVEDRHVLRILARSFADIKLKVQAAEAAGLDTMRSFRDEQEAYRAHLAQRWLTDSVALNQALHYRYNRLLRQGTRVQVQQLFRKLPQNVTATALRRAIVQMDSLYGALQQLGPDAFDDFVSRYSDDKSVRWVRRLEETAEFSDSVFALKPGMWSRPFFTPRGLHIVRVLQREEVPPFEVVRDSLLHAYPQCVIGAARVMAERLKSKDCRAVDKVSLSDAYVRKILFAEYARLEQAYPEFRLAVQAHREEALALAITRLEAGRGQYVGEDVLRRYFDHHRSHYHWDTPRYRGIVLRCSSRRVAKRVRKMLKHLPSEDWLNAIRLLFNNGSQQVQAEQGTFAPGDNAWVDERVFGLIKAPEVPDFEHVVLVGRKLKGPDDYREVRPVLLADYYAAREARWLDKLRASGKVEINQEVLKTVNNRRTNR